MNSFLKGHYGLPLWIGAALAMGCGDDGSDGVDTDDTGGGTVDSDTGFQASGPAKPDLWQTFYEFTVGNDGTIQPVKVPGQNGVDEFPATATALLIEGGLREGANGLELGQQTELVCIGRVPMQAGDGVAPSGGSEPPDDTDAVDTDTDALVDTDTDATVDTDTGTAPDTDATGDDLNVADWLAANNLRYGLDISSVSGRDITYQANNQGDPCEDYDDGFFSGGEPARVVALLPVGLPITLESSGNPNQPGVLELLLQTLQQQEGLTAQQASQAASRFYEGVAFPDADDEPDNGGWISGYEIDEDGVLVVQEVQGQMAPVPLESPFDDDGKMQPGYYTVESVSLFIAPNWAP